MLDNFRAFSRSFDIARWLEDISITGETARGKVIGPKMKKRKLGRALESVREDFRVGKHTGLSVLRVRFSPRSFSSPCHPRRSVGLLSSSYRTNSLFVRAFFARQPGGHVHARTCAICLRAQCPLILARYTLAGNSLRRSVGWLYVTRKSVKWRLFPNWLEDRHAINMRISFIHICTFNFYFCIQ